MVVLSAFMAEIRASAVKPGRDWSMGVLQHGALCRWWPHRGHVSDYPPPTLVVFSAAIGASLVVERRLLFRRQVYLYFVVVRS